jgi:hypothetical protein
MAHHGKSGKCSKRSSYIVMFGKINFLPSSKRCRMHKSPIRHTFPNISHVLNNFAFVTFRNLHSTCNARHIIAVVLNGSSPHLMEEGKHGYNV